MSATIFVYLHSFAFAETILSRSTVTAEATSLYGAGLSLRLGQASMVRPLRRPMNEMVNRLEVVTVRQVFARNAQTSEPWKGAQRGGYCAELDTQTLAIRRHLRT
jgi:hypothetical protein